MRLTTFSCGSRVEPQWESGECLRRRIVILEQENAALVERVRRLEEVLTAGIALMRATDPFTLPPDTEDDEGVSIRQLEPDAHIGWEEAPKAGEHIALHDAVLAFGRAVAEVKATP
jgi:hypothetical protein